MLAVKDIAADGWIKWRCPHCNAWDYALQQSPDKVVCPTPGKYDCTDCGEPFVIPNPSEVQRLG